MDQKQLSTKYFEVPDLRFPRWPGVVLLLLLAFHWKSAPAQSSAGTLTDPPASSNSGAATPATAARHNPKVDEFNARQQQELKNQKVIQAAGDSILNGLKGSGNSDLSPAALGEEDSEGTPSTEPIETPPPEANSGAGTLSDAAPPLPNSAAAVNSLLDNPPDSGTASNSAAAVNALLGDQTPPGAMPNSAAAVNSLLDDQAETGATPTAANAAANPAFESIIPRDPSFAAAMQGSQGSSPTPEVLVEVQEDADVANPSASVKDVLQGLVSTAKSDIASVKATLGTLMDTPTAQILDGCTCTTAPAILATDTPEQMAGKVHDQAILGFGYFTQSAFPKALYNYMSSNVNQFMTQLGFAAPQPDNGNQQ
jgi:hypothetical protein